MNKHKCIENAKVKMKKDPINLIVGIIIGIAVIGLIFLIYNPSRNEIVCNAPYIKVGDSCCLDENSNGICDSDEEPEQQEEEIIKPITTFSEAYEITVNNPNVIWSGEGQITDAFTSVCYDIKESVYTIVHLDRINDEIQCQVPNTEVGKEFPKMSEKGVVEFYGFIDKCDSETFRIYNGALSKEAYEFNAYVPRYSIVSSNDVYIVQFGCITIANDGTKWLSPTNYDIIDTETGKSLRFN